MRKGVGNFVGNNALLDALFQGRPRPITQHAPLPPFPRVSIPPPLFRTNVWPAAGALTQQFALQIGTKSASKQVQLHEQHIYSYKNEGIIKENYAFKCMAFLHLLTYSPSMCFPEIIRQKSRLLLCPRLQQKVSNTWFRPQQQ